MKSFNTTAVCIPSKHYMVDLTERVREIGELVEKGEYFTINRARQYGKTTTLNALKNYLTPKYVVISLDFQGISSSGFATEQDFVQEFSRLIIKRKSTINGFPERIEQKLRENIDQKSPIRTLGELFTVLSDWCELSEKPVVLIIDEVDSATNNQVFLDFLAQLRDGYISRNTDNTPAFWSVILAGVTDVKHLKRKIRDDLDSKENSPWNIAADFNIDMSLSESGIKGMLDEYEDDHKTGMDTAGMAVLIRAYTNGYPFLVSRLCELIDKRIPEKLGDNNKAWTSAGLDEAVKLILSERNTLFESLTTKLNNYPGLKKALRSILMEGTKLTYNPDQDDIAQMQMFGFIRNDHNTVRIDNRIFETRLYNLFMSEEEMRSNVFSREGDLAKNAFVEDGRLNLRLIFERFIATYHQVCGPLEEKFSERDGREQFLLYLKPIINGTGNYYIEAQTRDQKRTDVIIDYLGQQYVIELKIWHGERYNAEGEKQISDYLDYFGLTTGYMLSFNFNKKKETGVNRVQVGDKVLYEGTV